MKRDIAYLTKLLQAATSIPVVHRLTRGVTPPTNSLETQVMTANLTVSNPQGTNVHEASTHRIPQSTRLVNANLRTFDCTTAKQPGDSDGKSQGPEDGSTCPLCLDKRTDLSCLRCGHVFCTVYVLSSLDRNLRDQISDALIIVGVSNNRSNTVHNVHFADRQLISLIYGGYIFHHKDMFHHSLRATCT